MPELTKPQAVPEVEKCEITAPEGIVISGETIPQGAVLNLPQHDIHKFAGKIAKTPAKALTTKYK